MKRIVTWGEIMLRLATPGHARIQQALPGPLNGTFAGAEANIAAALAYWGRETRFVTALPEHSVADACLADLRSLGVDTGSVVRDSRGRLGIFFLEQGSGHRGGQVIYDREGSTFALTGAQSYDWETIFQDAACLVLTGITPALSSLTSENTFRVLEEAEKRRIPVVFDVNYRSKLWQWCPIRSPVDLAREILLQITPKAKIWVGGLSDAQAILQLSDDETACNAAKKLAEKFPQLEWIALTLRAGSSAHLQRFQGLLHHVQTGQQHLSPLYEMAGWVDRLGAGDAFTAALMDAWLQGEEPSVMIALAAAAGCLAHTLEGDFAYMTRAEIRAVAEGESVGRVSR